MALLTNPTFSLTPSQTPVVLASNYINTFDFSDTELPELMEDTAEIYGPRTVSGFLAAVGAEYAFTSDLIKWTEEGRLHTLYNDVTRAANVFTKNGHVFRVNQTILVSDGVVVERAFITATTTNTFTAVSYKNAGFSIGTTALSCFVYGSEFQKGTNGMQGALEADVSIRDNKPIILKDKYEVSGSDMAQIGWVKVNDGGNVGYLWYLRSNHETRLRFDDYLEMSMIESEPAEAGSDAETNNVEGMEGLLYVVRNRGNVFQSVMTGLNDFDAVLDRLDKQGSIQENALFVDRAQSLAIDDMLAAQNSYGAGGTSWGAFNNNEDMGLSLGFSDFRRGSYDFYKTDWKYLNDAATRGSINGTGRLRGVLAPMGTKTVYDQILGKRITRPFLHVCYRKSATEDRRYKSWVIGSAGGASNSDLDAMQVHFLSERSLITIGANNFVLIED
jgi:hypothetical protein